MATDKKKTGTNRKGIKFQIQSKISASIAIVMAVVMVLVVVVVYNLLINANNTEVRQDAEAVSLQVEKYFAPFERMAEQMALDGDVIELLDTTQKGQRMNENELYPTVLQKMVDVAGLDTENIQGVFVADLDSSASITSAGSISDASYDVTTRAWYVCTQTKSTVMTDVYVSASTGKSILSAATPVYNARGTVVGVVGIDIVIETIMDMMEDYTIGENGYTMLLDTNGNFIYHPNESWIDENVQNLGFTDNVYTAVTSGKSQQLKYVINGETKYGYIAPVGDTGFVAFSCIPFMQYYSTLITAVAMLIVVLVVGFVFIIISMEELPVRL